MGTLRPRLAEFDHRLLVGIVRRRTSRLDGAMRRLTRLGDAGPATLTSLVLALGVIPALEAAGTLALFTLVVSHGVVRLLKRTVTRPRPALPPGTDLLVQLPGCFSFPSGHAAAGLSLTLPLALAVPPPGGALLLALGLCVGLSRCYIGVHYPGDVLAAWAVTAACAAAGVLLGVPLP